MRGCSSSQGKIGVPTSPRKHEPPHIERKHTGRSDDYPNVGSPHTNDETLDSMQTQFATLIDPTIQPQGFDVFTSAWSAPWHAWWLYTNAFKAQTSNTKISLIRSQYGNCSTNYNTSIDKSHLQIVL